MTTAKIITIAIEALIPISLFLFLFIYYIKDRDSKYYKKIDLKNKNQYLPGYYLCGDSHLLPNLAIISKTQDGYLIETEDKRGRTDNFFIKFSDVSIVNIKSVDSKNQPYDVRDPKSNKNSKSYKIRKGYEIRIITKHDLKLTLLSKKNPKLFFNK